MLEGLMPEFDAVRLEHLVVPGSVSTAYEAVRNAVFIDGWRGTTAVRTLAAARALPDRGGAAVNGGAATQPRPSAPERLDDLPRLGDWVVLAEDPPRRIFFGAVARFRAGETTWEEIDPRDFAALERPGLAKIAAGFSLVPYGARYSLVSYECRAIASNHRMVHCHGAERQERA